MTARWLEIAWEQEGSDIREIGGPVANGRIIAYFHDQGRTDITSDEVPWCAAAYFWCLMKAGLPVSSIPESERLLAWSATKFGTRIDQPRVGAGCVMKRQGGHHVGFIVSWTATTIKLLGGNQRDSFCVAEFKRSADMIFMWPGAVSVRDLDETSRISRAAKRQQKDAAKVVVPQAIPEPTSIFPAPDALAAKAQGLQGSLETFVSFLEFFGRKWPVVMLAVGAYFLARMAYDGWLIRGWRAEDASTGKTEVARV